MSDDSPPNKWGPTSAGWSDDAARVDLLVLGALTIDRFARGQTAPGGSVIHATRAAAASGFSVAVATMAGDEPEAEAGLRELRGLTAAVHVQPAIRTARFRHREAGRGRRLFLEASADDLKNSDAVRNLAHPRAVLLAPVAGELGSDAVQLFSEAPWRPVRSALLQGWLRTLDPGHPVRPLGLEALDERLVGAIADLDVLVVSREDLGGPGLQPHAQLDDVRQRFGDHPLCILTDGVEGAWVDDRRYRSMGSRAASERWHEPVPRRVERVATVGAGDALAAVFVAQLWPSWPFGAMRPSLRTAMERVADILEARL